MEVHHHPHVGKKNFKEYLLEGLMIFLAVSMGFIAENIRTYFEEKHQEREYIESMINDLKVDASNIQVCLNENNQNQLRYADSLIKYLDREKWGDIAKAAIYLYSLRNSLSYTVNFSNETIIQLKSGGGARLIKHRAALDSIMAYDHDISYLERVGNGYTEASRLLNDIRARIFYAKSLNAPPDLFSFGIPEVNHLSKMSSNDNKQVDWFIKNGKANMLMVDNDPKDLNEYINKVKRKKDIIKNYLRLLQNAKSQSMRLIQFLQKEYHLEKE